MSFAGIAIGGGALLGGIASSLIGGKSAKKAARTAAEPAQRQVALAEEQFELLRPLFTQAAGQLEELQRTGGIGALLPIVSRATEAARVGGSQTLAQTGERLSRTGITGTERERILGDLSRAINLDISQIPVKLQFPILQAVFQNLLGQPAVAAQNLSSGVGALGALGRQQLAGAQTLQQTGLGLGSIGVLQLLQTLFRPSDINPALAGTDVGTGTILSSGELLLG